MSARVDAQQQPEQRARCARAAARGGVVLCTDACACALCAVFFDVSIGGLEAGRIKMELFKDVAPKTAENFRRAAQSRRLAPQP